MDDRRENHRKGQMIWLVSEAKQCIITREHVRQVETLELRMNTSETLEFDNKTHQVQDNRLVGCKCR